MKISKKLFKLLFPRYYAGLQKERKMRIALETKSLALETKNRGLEAKSRELEEKAKTLQGYAAKLKQHVESKQDVFLVLTELLYEKLLYANAKLLAINMTAPIRHIKSPSSWERQLQQRVPRPDFRELCGPQHLDDIVKFYDDKNYSRDEIYELFNANVEYNDLVVKHGQTQLLKDLTGPFFNVSNNSRVTTDTPHEYDNRIFIFGNCLAAGVFTEDQYSFPSQLQRLLNSKKINGKTYKVENHANRAIRSYEVLCQALLPRYVFGPGDLVILFQHMRQQALAFWKAGASYHDISPVFDRPHKFGDKEILFDDIHCTHRGYELISERVYNAITEVESAASTTKVDAGDAELAIFLQSLQENRFQIDPGARRAAIGSIVMNCNPFTLGHQFLIDTALKQCDYLYIFLVEENRSDFPFEHRWAMIHEAMADRPNVKIFPSGKFIISTATLPEYFEKDVAKDIKLDASQDLTIFASKIAPSLGIKKRFVGHEPFCNITRQYNDGMKEIMPKFGIDLIEIARTESEGRGISASEVRACLKSGDHERIARIVPPTTYDFLKRHYFTAANQV